MTVTPANASDILKQWLDVHGLPLTPMSERKDDGYEHAVWWNDDGETVIEFYHIPSMAHGTPLGLGEGDEYFGAAGPFLIDAGISSTYHIATFFGLTDKVHRPRDAEGTISAEPVEMEAAEVDVTPHIAPEAAERFEKLRQFSKVDVSAVIAKALTAAGLLK
jgi:hypothetical protein